MPKNWVCGQATAFLALNDEPVIDLIDYKYFTSLNKYSVTIQQEDGEAVIYDIEQDEDEFLGLCFKDDLIKVKRCQNKCVFCFVDQLPQFKKHPLRKG